MSVESYYTSLETRLGNALFFGGRSHLPYYPSLSPNAGLREYIKLLSPFPIYPALLAMENHLLASLKIQGQGQGREVLDAGCGTGDMAIYFSKRGLKVHAIDLLPDKVTISRKNVEMELGRVYKTGNHGAVKSLESLSIQEGDYHDLSPIFPENKFDAVYTIEALAHATDLPAVLGEFYRVLKPGGRIALYEYDHWMSSTSTEDEMSKVHQYGGIDPTATGTSATTTGGREKDGRGLAAIVRDTGFTDVHEEDLSENVRPLLRFLVVCLFVPYMIVRVLGLEARFINTVAVVVNYRRGWKYVGVTGRKA
ncbi:hypothetical protein SI65_09218 [Aspergillus cristatus]|uniref:Methyltransferase type 11 domain-containing protein n=1 Tax=Aspergillus cristatus TaxID=573508 RepID=A0A1E3B2W7_ASPCR|nr:hypothetical protein SI65_09218 [Aspergillus cristatus]